MIKLKENKNISSIKFYKLDKEILCISKNLSSNSEKLLQKIVYEDNLTQILCNLFEVI